MARSTDSTVIDAMDAAILRGGAEGSDAVRSIIQDLLKERAKTAEDLQNQLQQQQQQQQQLQQQIQALQQSQPPQQTTTTTTNHRRIPLSKQRGVEAIPMLSSKEGFVTFVKKTLAFCEDEPGLTMILKKVTKEFQNTPIEDKHIEQWLLEREYQDVPLKILNRELRGLLTARTEGIAWGLVDRSDGGFEAWRKLHYELEPKTAKTKRNLLKNILFPGQVAKPQDVQSAQADWELKQAKYTELTNKRVDDEYLVLAYENMLPDQIQKSIANLQNELVNLREMQEYAKRQIDSMTEPDDYRLITPKRALNSCEERGGGCNEQGTEEKDVAEAVQSILAGIACQSYL